MMKTYSFDCKLAAAMEASAPDEATAKRMVRAALHVLARSVAATADGPVTFVGISLDDAGGPLLVEVDGVEV